MTETHSGIVFFAGERAYKLKKPVNLGFLDFRSRTAREAACHREVELNRRLAPDVYLGVADVAGPDGEYCDHLVVMRRLPASRRLTAMVARGEPVGMHLRQLARLLAAFHAKADTSAEIGAAASRDALAARWEANAAEMSRFAGLILDPAMLDRVIGRARRYLAGRVGLLAARVAAGRARDGHGDLLADDIFCLDDGPRVLDCIEFDDRLRWDDVLADVAFLAMDLERLGRADLALTFLRDYREFAADYWPASLAHHYIAYRAQVRAKVAALSWTRGAPVAGEAARQLLGIADAHLQAGRIRLVVIGGLPGTGKSTIATAVGEAIEGAVLRSDEVRKQLAGLDPASAAPAPFGQGLYRAEVTAATYSELLARARACLSRGQSAVLDASWLGPAWRDAAHSLAVDMVADLAEFCCVAPPAVIAQRITGRAAYDGDASDATVAVAQELAAVRLNWPTATLVDTTPPPGEVLHGVLGALAVQE